MSSQFCPKCGKSNLPASAFCANCGAPLTTSPTAPQQGSGGVPPSSIPPPAPSPYQNYAVSYYEANRRQGTDRTKTGLLLLVIGFFIGWIPFVSIVGSILELIGAIMVILGRHVFSPEHARNVFWAVIIFIIGIVAGVAAVLVVVFSAIAGNLQFVNRTTPLPFRPSLFDPTAFFTGILIGVAIVQVSFVLLTYALQKRNGRILLFLGYAATLTVALVNFFVLSSNILLSAIPSLVPALLYGYAYNLARIRVEHGEIPGSPAQPSPATSGYFPQ